MSLPTAVRDDVGRAYASDTRLRGRMLRLARISWVVLALGTLALFVASLPSYYLRLQVPCVGVVACNVNGVLGASAIQTLQAAGISQSAYATYTVVLSAAVMLPWTVVGLLIYWRRSDDWMALLASLTLVLYNPGQQDQALTALALAHPVWTVPVEVITFLSEVPIVFLLLLFPSGRFEPRWIRWLVPLALIQTAYSIFLPDTVVTASGWLSTLNGLLFIGFLLLVVFSQIFRYRRVATATQRQQIKWVVFGIILTAGLLVGLSSVYLIPGLYQPGSLTELVVNSLYPLAALPLPVSIGIAILRSRLWDIDIVINRTLVYGSLTAILAAVYFGSVVAMQQLVRVVAGETQQNNPLVIVLSTLLIVVLFNPLCHRIQVAIDRRFYRTKYDAQKTLATFGAALRSETDLPRLTEHLVGVVTETMQPTHISLWLPAIERKPARPEIPEGFMR